MVRRQIRREIHGDSMDRLGDLFDEPTSSGSGCSNESHDWTDGWGPVCDYQVPSESSYVWTDSTASDFTDTTYWRGDD